jgi:hypothetical protein
VLLLEEVMRRSLIIPRDEVDLVPHELSVVGVGGGGDASGDDEMDGLSMVMRILRRSGEQLALMNVVDGLSGSMIRSYGVEYVTVFFYLKI